MFSLNSFVLWYYANEISYSTDLDISNGNHGERIKKLQMNPTISIYFHENLRFFKI